MRLFSLFLTGCLIMISAPVSAAKTETAIFAGGCFWCMHAAFEGLDGVTKVTSGYTGGDLANPTYDQVSTGETGHIEAIEATYDPDKVSYDKLLERFWDNVDPTDPKGQFCDKGSQYAAGIFYTTPEQQTAAQQSITKVEEKLKQKVATFLRPAKTFYEAEDYHQSYYKKNTLRYELYKNGCGRAKTLEKVWGK
jgi:peptide-methionine (S)-S-oxide reductase